MATEYLLLMESGMNWTIPQLWTLMQSQGEHSFCGGPQQSHCVSYHHVAGTSVSACLCTRKIGLVCVMQLKEVREACWAMPVLPLGGLKLGSKVGTWGSKVGV